VNPPEEASDTDSAYIPSDADDDDSDSGSSGSAVAGDASDIAGVSESEEEDEDEDEDEDDPETPGVDLEQGSETPGVDSNSDDDEPIAGEPPPTKRRLRSRKPINYNDMSAASHLKMVGFSSLMSGTADLNTALRGYCHVAKV